VWSPLASGWLSGAIREGREITTSRSTFMPQNFDTTVAVNRAKLDAVEQLAKVANQAGLTMIQLALGFVTAQPAVTSAIIGPRTMDHLYSQLAAADTVLPPDVLAWALFCRGEGHNGLCPGRRVRMSCGLWPLLLSRRIVDG
jgi:aryl-alcohol dehydrogenase-like predicted oxidoreductase